MTIREAPVETEAQNATPTPDPEINWDGIEHSYRPRPDWMSRVSPALQFHRDVDPDLDPVTFEVIRNRLWSMNLSHGETLVRISGSPTFQGLDFGMNVMTEDAEIVMNGPFLIYLASGGELASRYIMENFGDEPGIEPGDMFVCNDPWIGAVHQMDVMVCCPVFVDGKLFAWVSNAGHQYDLGGIVPGGWPQNALDVFSDPVMLRPFKLVEGGVMRTDLEQMYRRFSRTPGLVALDLRAQIAGCRFASQQLTDICEEFGPATVKAAMRRNLDNAQLAMQRKLERIPGGTWSQVRYVDQKVPGDRHTYRTQVNVTKRGDRLIVDNEGTDPQQDGPIGFVYASFAGAFLGVASVTLLWEQMFSTGGAARQIDFNPTPGLLSCVDHPAPVSGAVMNIVVYMNDIMMIMSRMLACDEELKKDIIGSQITTPLLVLAGSNDRGQYVGTALFEMTGMGTAARADGDGIDTGGTAWSPLMRMLNIEALEQFFPLLYLYRREAVDGGGAGEWRGGTGAEYAVIPYRAESLEAITNTGGMGASADGGGLGMFGGWPTPTSYFRVHEQTEIEDLFAKSQIPDDIEGVASERAFFIPGRSNGTPLGPQDIMEGLCGGGGGYGDPLRREPDRVARDVELGYVSADAALRIYGVVLGEDGALDEAGTDRTRKEAFARRLEWMPAADLPGETGSARELTTPASGEPPQAIQDNVVSRDAGYHRVLACAHCETTLSDHTGNFKQGMLVHEGSPEDIPRGVDPALFLDDTIVFRQYCCPGCGVIASTEVARPDEPALPEITLRRSDDDLENDR